MKKVSLKLLVLFFIFSALISGFAQSREVRQAIGQARTAKRAAAPLYQNPNRPKGYDHLYTRGNDLLNEAIRVQRTSPANSQTYARRAKSKFESYVANVNAYNRRNNNRNNQNNNSNARNNNNRNRQRNYGSATTRLIQETRAKKAQADRYHRDNRRNKRYDYLYTRGNAQYNEMNRIIRQGALGSAVRVYAGRAKGYYHRYNLTQRVYISRQGNSNSSGSLQAQALSKINYAVKLNTMAASARRRSRSYFNYYNIATVHFRAAQTYYRRRSYGYAKSRAEKAIRFFKLYLTRHGYKKF